MDPALMCTSTGDGEQTIDQIQTRGEHGRFIFFMGWHVPRLWRETPAMFLRWVRFPSGPPNINLIYSVNMFKFI